MNMALYPGFPGLEFLLAPTAVIWRTLRAFAQAFPEEVIYFLMKLRNYQC